MRCSGSDIVDQLITFLAAVVVDHESLPGGVGRAASRTSRGPTGPRLAARGLKAAWRFFDTNTGWKNKVEAPDGVGVIWIAEDRSSQLSFGSRKPSSIARH
jgi:hypothetical protein